jgi:hypothetical protein
MKFFVKHSTFVGLFFGIFFLIIPLLVQAQGGGGSNSITLFSTLDGISSICQLLQKLLGVLLAFGVPIAVLFLVYAGFLFVKARGNPKELIRARTNFKYVILGIMLFLGAWMLGQIVASTVNTLGAGSGAPGVGSCR